MCALSHRGDVHFAGLLPELKVNPRLLFHLSRRRGENLQLHALHHSVSLTGHHIGFHAGLKAHQARQLFGFLPTGGEMSGQAALLNINHREFSVG